MYENINQNINETNFKKIKYILKKTELPNNINIDEYTCKININCSYEFLLDKFGKSLIICPNDTILHKAKWIVNVQTSNNYNYYITIFDCKEYETNLKDITNWYIAGIDYDFLDYTKLSKLFNFEYKKYTKKIKKLFNINFQNQIYNDDLTKYIDENKYKQMDIDILSNFTDDDLTCILITRFKNSYNFLIKEALLIHKGLTLPKKYNYNKIKDKTKYNNK
jgi:hypothetical protein